MNINTNTSLRITIQTDYGMFIFVTVVLLAVYVVSGVVKDTGLLRYQKLIKMFLILFQNLIQLKRTQSFLPSFMRFDHKQEQLVSRREFVRSLELRQLFFTQQ